MNTVLAVTIETSIRDAILTVLMLAGSLFCITASVGLARMPDLYMRMQAATKAGTLGVGCLLLATGIYFGTLEVLVQCVLVVLFLFLTAPIASHLIGRAAYLSRVKPWEKSIADELAGCYDPETHRLSPTPDARRRESELGDRPVFHGDETMFGRGPSETHRPTA
ncbi:MAG: monovalent cation/H(+) antiporter subunit G [Deltaproteobacteria bacterium]|nr:monovalent cation/H(+) antiporter subunit G [Deltaproteobacteria bacterium]